MKQNDTRRRAIVDFTVIFLIILIVSLIIYLFADTVFGREDGAKSTIEYTVRVGEVREEMLSLISVGDKIIDSVGKYSVGEVVSAEARQSSAEILHDGALVPSPIEQRWDLFITVRAQAGVGETDISIDGFNLKIGRVLYLRFPRLCAACECVEIHEVGNEA